MLLLGAATAGLAAASSAAAWLLGLRRRTDAVTGALCLFLIALTALSKALLLAGWYAPVPLAAASLAVAGATWAAALRPGPRARIAAGAREFRVRPRLPRSFPALAALGALAVTAGVYLYRAAIAVRMPPRDIDSLWYHLVSVSGWVRNGDLSPAIEGVSRAGRLGWTVVSETYPRDFELVVSWLAVFTGDTTLIGLSQFPFALLLFSGTYGICRRLDVRRPVACAAACAVVLAPICVGQVYTAFNDIARAAIPAAAWHLLLVALPPGADSAAKAGTAAADTATAVGRSRRALPVLLLVGLVLGLGLGIKPANGYLIPFALISMLVLARVRRLRGLDAPRPLSALFAVGAPAAVVGSFWYLITWYRWGSPVWPLRTGPFAGPMCMDQLVDAQRPTGWESAAGTEMILHSWLDAVFGFGRPVWYAEWTGQLGLAWVLLLLPAVVVLVVLALIVKKHRVAAYAVVLPILLGTLAPPGRWFSRYTIPVLIAGAVAFAVLCGTGREARIRRATPARLMGRWADRLPRVAGLRLPLPGTAAVLVVALAVTAVAGTVGVLRWSNYRPEEDPVARDYRETAALLVQPSGVRSRTGLWKEYAELDNIPRDSRIAFCAQDPPSRHAPFLLIGRDFGNVLVDLGVCPSAYAARMAMDKVDADYLFASDRTTIGRRIKPRQDEFGLKRITSATEPVGSFGVFHVYKLVGAPLPGAKLPLPPVPQAAPVPPGAAGAPGAPAPPPAAARPADKRPQPKLPAFSAAATARSPEYSQIRPDSGQIGCDEE